jgi:mono/diheme cytochrome c family protein
MLRNALASILLLVALAAVASGQEAQVGNLVGDAHHGKDLYRRYCIGCHGARGDGLGDNAPWMDPKPRDFTAATFKCRSTPTGTLPTDEDLYNTLERGVHASGMPSWNALTRRQRIDLVAYVKSLSPRFKEEKPGTPVAIPPATPNTSDSVDRGQKLFEKMNCWSCHGRQGRGNGPSSVGLTDSKGFPITPYDFTGADRFKCGETDQDLFRVLVTGLDGTPMPSFSDAMDANQLWDIVHYLQTFRGKKAIPLQRTSAPPSGIAAAVARK